MANFLDTDPQLAECIEHHRRRGQFVPIAGNGDFAALVNRRHIEAYPVPETITAADYVVGLELLGFRFFVGEAHALWIKDLEEEIPEAWDRRSLQIMAAFRGRRREVVDFLLERDGVPA